jgi:ABC-type antimicrobial peptide transport system permease subunit
MGVAGLILGSLIGMTVASVAASTIGELVIGALWLDLNFPYIAKMGGDCAIISNATFAVCVFSGVTFLLFIVAAILYVIAQADVAKFLALGGVALYLGVFICAVIIYAKAPTRDEDGQYDPFTGKDCDETKFEYDKWSEHWNSKLDSYEEGARGTIMMERTMPVQGWLTYMIWSIISLVLLIVVVVLVILKFPGIYDILPSHQSVAPAP